MPIVPGVYNEFQYRQTLMKIKYNIFIRLKTKPRRFDILKIILGYFTPFVLGLITLLLTSRKYIFLSEIFWGGGGELILS